MVTSLGGACSGRLAHHRHMWRDYANYRREPAEDWVTGDAREPGRSAAFSTALTLLLDLA